MFNDRQSDALKSFSGKLFEIRTSDKILSNKKYTEQVRLLQDILQIDKELFNDFYWGLFASVIGYMQFLPDPRMSGAAIADVVLAKAKTACEHVVKYKDQRFQYAYISLSVLYDLGFTFVDYDIFICDHSGEVLLDWHPLVRGLDSYEGYFYKVRPTNIYPKNLRFDVNPILACNILPESALCFLKEDPLLFSQWLRALSGKDDTGDLIIDFSKVGSVEASSVFDSVIVSDLYGDAEAFWYWLQEKITHDDKYEVIDGQVIVDLDAYLKNYCQKNNKDFYSIKNNLGKIGVLGAKKSFNSKFSNVVNVKSPGMFSDVRKDSKQGFIINKSIALGKDYLPKDSSMANSIKNFNDEQKLIMSELDKNQQAT